MGCPMASSGTLLVPVGSVEGGGPGFGGTVGSAGYVVVAAVLACCFPGPAAKAAPSPGAQGDQRHGAGGQAGPGQDRPPRPPSGAPGTSRPGRRGR